MDGIINKGGPTEKAISGALEQQSLNTTNPMEAVNNSTPSNVTVSKPVSSNPDQKSFTASASFGPKPKSVAKPKIDPMTGVADLLANAPKANKSMTKAWDEFYKTQEQKAQTAIVPKGNTAQQAIMSLMQNPRYNDKNDTRLREHVVKQFERAFPGEVQYDETGKMVQPTAVIAPDQIEAFDPDGELQPMTASAETTVTKPAVTAMMVEDTGNEKTSQNDSYDKSEQKFTAETNEEYFAEDGYKELDFDPKGNGQYDFAIRNPLDGYEANSLHNEAVEKVKELYKGQRTARNDEADAFRHAYWSYRATQEIGEDAAKQAGNGHEITKPNEDGERLMDLYNNKIGRELALDPKNKDRDPVEVIQEAIANGKLRKRPFRLRGQKNQLRLPWQ